MGNLNGKIAIVTGASRGIGSAIALRLAEEGARVVINYVSNASKAEAVVQQIEATGGEALLLQADMSKLAEVRRFFAEVDARLGRLDILVNNAGVGVYNPLEQTSEEEYERVFSLNAKGTYFAAQEATRRLGENGRIVNISTAATVAITPGFSAYAASKGAVEQLTYALAHELGPKGITVNAVLPGLTDTDSLILPAEQIASLVASTPLRRLGQPRDIADIVAFLVSDQARWVTGQTIRAAGGMI